MAKALELGVGDLVAEFLAHAKVIFRLLKSARAVTVFPLKTVAYGVNDFLVGVKNNFHILFLLDLFKKIEYNRSMSKILVNVENLNDLNSYNGEYDGVYVKLNPSVPVDDILTLVSEGKQVFFDFSSLPANHCLGFAKNLKEDVTFVVDDFQKAIFIKTVRENASIYIFYDGYDEMLVPFLSCNKFNITVKYTALAPERIKKFQDAGVLVNGYILTREDEVGILKFWNVDYITVDKNIKP